MTAEPDSFQKFVNRFWYDFACDIQIPLKILVGEAKAKEIMDRFNETNKSKENHDMHTR